MKVHSVGGLCNFIYDTLSCEGASCDKCPVSHLNGDRNRKIVGELKLVCEHVWDYDVPDKYAVTRQCTQCLTTDSLYLTQTRIKSLFSAEGHDE